MVEFLFYLNEFHFWIFYSNFTQNKEMIKSRTYGSPPFKIAVIHGGSRRTGYMAPVAKELSKNFGIIEPMQTEDSIVGQVEELYSILYEQAQMPITLIGHSWGGFLSLIFTSMYPELVSKLILISCGPFEDKYVKQLKKQETHDYRKKKRRK